MSRKTVLSVLFSLFLAACGGLDETPATNMSNVADAGETADAGASCPTCPACPEADAGTCPTCPPPMTVVSRGTLTATLGPNTPAGVTTIAPDNDRDQMEIVLCANVEAVQASEIIFFLSGIHGSIGAWEIDIETETLATGQVPTGAGHFSIGFANLVIQPGQSNCKTLRLRLDTSRFNNGDTLFITMEQANGLGVSSNEAIATSGRLTTSWTFVGPVTPQPSPRLVVHFSANTPQGPSVPAFEERMVRAILFASTDESIRVDTVSFRVRATSPGLGNWALRWDNGPPGNLDSGITPNYSNDWAIITAHVNMELPAGSNMAVSLYIDTQTMQTNDAVSLQITGATGVGMISGEQATVTVPTATVVHTY